MEKYQEGLGEFSSHTKFEVGDGSKIMFWHDVWGFGMMFGDEAFKKALPNLYSILALRMLPWHGTWELSNDSH